MPNQAPPENEMTEPAGNEQQEMSAPGTEDATPEEEAELQRAQAALGDVLYKNDASFNAIVKKLSSQNVPAGDRLVDTTVMLVGDIDGKINLDEAVILEFTSVVYDALYEIGQTAEVMEIPDKDLKQGLSVALQLIMETYGVDAEEYNEFIESMGEKGANDLINFYKGETANG